MYAPSEDEAGVPAILDAFTAFFDKVVANQPKKESLQNQLLQLKTNILADLTNFEPAQKFIHELKDKLAESKSSINKSQSDLNLKTFYASSEKVQAQNIKRISLFPISEFCNKKLPRNSTHRAYISTKYSQMREFIPDSNNLYRSVGLSLFEMLLKEDSTRRVEDYIDQLLCKKLLIKSWIYPYTPEELVAVLCGYLQQLLKMKTANEEFKKIKETLYDMANQDSQFDSAVISLIKETILNYLGETDMAILKQYVPSVDNSNVKDFIKKIYNNDFTFIEEIFAITTVVFPVSLTVQVFANQGFQEKSYPYLKPQTTNRIAIHLLYEKDATFNSLSILVPKEDVVNRYKENIPNLLATDPSQSPANKTGKPPVNTDRPGLPPKTEIHKTHKGLTKIIQQIDHSGRTHAPVQQGSSRASHSVDHALDGGANQRTRTVELSKTKAAAPTKSPRFLTPSRAQNFNFFNETATGNKRDKSVNKHAQMDSEYSNSRYEAQGAGSHKDTLKINTDPLMSIPTDASDGSYYAMESDVRCRENQTSRNSQITTRTNAFQRQQPAKVQAYRSKSNHRSISPRGRMAGGRSSPKANPLEKKKSPRHNLLPPQVASVTNLKRLPPASTSSLPAEGGYTPRHPERSQNESTPQRLMLQNSGYKQVNTSICDMDHDRSKTFETDHKYSIQDDLMGSVQSQLSHNSSHQDLFRPEMQIMPMHQRGSQPASMGNHHHNTSHERIRSLVTLAPINMESLPSNPFSSSFQSSVTSSSQKADFRYYVSDNSGYGATYQEQLGMQKLNTISYPIRDNFYESKYKPSITQVNSYNAYSEPYNSYMVKSDSNYQASSGSHQYAQTMKNPTTDSNWPRSSTKRCVLCQREVVNSSNNLDFEICFMCKKS